MTISILIMSILIALARVTDITLDTLRTVAIVQGRRWFAAFVGFFEALIYIVAVAQVLAHFDHRIYAVAYACGFAAGTFLGIVIDQRLAFGEQLVALFTREAAVMVPALRQEGFRVTEFTGRGRDGEVCALFIEVARRRTRILVGRARALDPACFYVVNDVCAASAGVAAVTGTPVQGPPQP